MRAQLDDARGELKKKSSEIQKRDYELKQKEATFAVCSVSTGRDVPTA